MESKTASSAAEQQATGSAVDNGDEQESMFYELQSLPVPVEMQQSKGLRRRKIKLSSLKIKPPSLKITPPSLKIMPPSLKKVKEDMQPNEDKLSRESKSLKKENESLKEDNALMNQTLRDQAKEIDRSRIALSHKPGERAAMETKTASSAAEQQATGSAADNRGEQESMFHEPGERVAMESKTTSSAAEQQATGSAADNGGEQESMFHEMKPKPSLKMQPLKAMPGERVAMESKTASSAAEQQAAGSVADNSGEQEPGERVAMESKTASSAVEQQAAGSAADNRGEQESMFHEPPSVPELRLMSQMQRLKAIDRHHFKVPNRLRQVNQTAYEPVLVSIGPCHRHKEHLQEMEMIKMQYFNRLFTRKGEETKQRCVDAMRNMVEIAQYWYEASVDDTTDIERMMLVDGCFIIELLCEDPQDQIVKLSWKRINLFVDLLLLENQLPFVVLKELYGLIKDPTDGTDFDPQAFAELIQVLSRSGIGTVNPSTNEDSNDIDHLLGLVHDNWVPYPQGRLEHVKSIGQEEAEESIGCARKLEEAGIEFIKVDSNQESNAKSLFDVSFIDGKMKIPMFVIDDNTERLFRNLIAYELSVQGPTYVIDYVTLMNNLVNTADDVKLLRSCGVIQSKIGDNKAVAQMLNKLRYYVTLSGDTFLYEKIFVDVQQHCKRPWNTWKAKLRHDYFSTPWTRISFAAALLVFLISIIQFILSFFKKKLGIEG